MELIYFVLGMLTILWINSTYQTFQTNKTNKDIQEKLNIMDNYITETSKEYFKQWENAMESMAKVSVKLEAIQEQLDAEDLETTLDNIGADINRLSEITKQTNDKLAFTNATADKNFNKTFNDIQALRNALNKMGQDPNLMSQY
jgi:septal ring factor EnvC (AmiA/AmiB activator)